MTKISFANEKEWHEIRSRHIGGSEIACLFNSFIKDGRRIYRHLFDSPPEGAAFEGCLSPFKSGVRLWHEKKGNIENKFSGNKSTNRGRRLEEAVAGWVWDEYREKFEKEGLLFINKYMEYDEHPDVPVLGATLDYVIENFNEYVDNENRDRRPLECKTVSVYAGWDYEATEPPLYYSMQLQGQISCIGAKQGYLGAAIFDADKLFFFEQNKNEKTINKILEAAQAFADALASGREPSIMYDVKAARDVYAVSDNEEVLDATNDDALTDLVFLWSEAKEKAKNQEKETKAMQDEIIARIKTASTVYLADGSKLSAKTVNRKGYQPGFVEPCSYRTLLLSNGK